MNQVGVFAAGNIPRIEQGRCVVNVGMQADCIGGDTHDEFVFVVERLTGNAVFCFRPLGSLGDCPDGMHANDWGRVVAQLFQFDRGDPAGTFHDPQTMSELKRRKVWHFGTQRGGRFFAILVDQEVGGLGPNEKVRIVQLGNQAFNVEAGDVGGSWQRLGTFAGIHHAPNPAVGAIAVGMIEPAIHSGR